MYIKANRVAFHSYAKTFTARVRYIDAESRGPAHLVTELSICSDALDVQIDVFPLTCVCEQTESQRI